MSGEIKKIDSIKNMAVFQDFRWDTSVRNDGNSVAQFKKINILYGRNYSGKTTLSRILRAMETGVLSDKYENPSFSVTFVDGAQAAQNTLTTHGKKIRVFNEDFVRDNLCFMTNPDDSIEAFAILGDDNNKIEKEIETLEREIGSKEEGSETGLYAEKLKVTSVYEKTRQEHKKANDRLAKQLGDKATDRKIGIKYKPERFGDQNYNIQKLKTDIGKVQDANYQLPTGEQLTQCEKLISEKTLQPINPFHAPTLNISTLIDETEILVTKKISESDKIEELVKDAILNRWVNDGRAHHKDKRNKCAFCGNPITVERWSELERHFDKESEQLENDIDALIARIEAEKSAVISALSIDKDSFYSKFRSRIDDLDKVLRDVVGTYTKSLETLVVQLKARKDDVLNPKSFEKPAVASSDLIAAWKAYNPLCQTS